MRNIMKKIVLQVACIGLLALLPAVVVAFAHPKRLPWRFEAFLNGPLWVDARSLTDYRKSHVPAALPLNEDEWDRLLPSVLEAWFPGRLLVVYCDGKRCDDSHSVARRLRVTGIDRVYVLKGGWEDWLKAQ